MPTSGLPRVAPGHELPEDLLAFYQAAGGLRLEQAGGAWTRVLGPAELLPSNPLIVGEQVSDDITASWYLIALTDNGDYLSIDLDPERLGRSYDSHHEIHGLAGECPVIALSFSELVERLLAARAAYWTEESFQSYGDAYDAADS
ncbi:MAG: SMI1/KNR4 family protein [Nocardioidaceae bacterium]